MYSRSSILTGQYVHNHGVYQDQASTGCYSLSWRKTSEQRTIGVHLAKAGYKTGFFGTIFTTLYTCADIFGIVVQVCTLINMAHLSQSQQVNMFLLGGAAGQL